MRERLSGPTDCEDGGMDGRGAASLTSLAGGLLSTGGGGVLERTLNETSAEVGSERERSSERERGPRREGKGKERREGERERERSWFCDFPQEMTTA